MRVVMLVTESRTFRWDWLEAARGCAQVIALEPAPSIADWPPLAGAPYLAPNPEDPLHYRFVPATKLPYRLFGPLADTRLVSRMDKVLTALANTHGPIDVVHAHFYSGARFLPQLKRRTSIPYVITEHSTALTLESPDKQVGPRGLRIARRAYADAATVMPVSASLERAIRTHGLTGRFRVVDNPVDMRRFTPPAQPPPAPPIRLINVARLAAVKGHELLLRCVRTLLDEGYELSLTVVGDGPLRDALHKIRDDLDLRNHVHFAGHRPREHIAESLRESHFFVLPSVTENLPVAVIEAMASGLPVIATEVGGVPEMIDEGETGHLVPPRDDIAFSNALRAVMNVDGFDRQDIARRAHRRYSFDRASSILEEVYTDAASRSA